MKVCQVWRGIPGLVWFGWYTHKALASKNLMEWGIFLNFASCRTLCNECFDMSQGQPIKRRVFETLCVPAAAV